MNIYSIVFLLAVIFVLGCQTESAVEFNLTHNLSKYKDSSLNYEWAFNNTGNFNRGNIHNSTYFELPAESCVAGIPWLNNTVSCPITFKHEEGHIFLFTTLNVTFLNEITSIKVSKEGKNITINDWVTADNTGYGLYVGRLSEGIPEYYSLTFFYESLTSTYLKSLLNYLNETKQKDCKKPPKDNDRPQFYYCGYLFVNYSIAEGFYASLKEVIADFGTERQYEYYRSFVKHLKK